MISVFLVKLNNLYRFRRCYRL